MAPDVGLAKGACSLWQEDLLLDYTIEVEDEQFRVHKVVMASVSDYFKAMLTGGMVESREDKVRLEGLSTLAVKDVIEFVYTGQFGSSKVSVEERLACAVYLQIPAAVKMCTTSLCEEVDKENCFRLLSIFKSYSVKDGIKCLTRYIQSNIIEILQTCKVEKLSFNEFLNFMDCWNKEEFELFELADQWLREDFDSREQHANEILSHIRFSLIASHQIAAIKEHEIFSACEGPWRDFVEKAETYQSLPTHHKVLVESEQSRRRFEPSPVWFPLDCYRDPDQIYVLREGTSSHYTWDPDNSTQGPQFRERPKYLEVNNFLIASDEKRQWYILDPQICEWSPIASMDKTRAGFALVFHQKHLYALGGTVPTEEAGLPADVMPRPNLDSPNISTVAVDLIERYDFQTNNWSVVSSKLPECMSHPEAFSIGGFIYVVFGRNCKNDILRSFDIFNIYCLDLNTNTWSKKASTPRKVCLEQDIVLLELHGEQVIAAFDLGFELNYYKPSTDQWSVYDLSDTSNLTWCLMNSRMHAHGNTLFFLNFQKNTDHADMENEDMDHEDIKDGVCEKWTLGDEGPQVETSLEEVPFQYGYYALLAIAIPSIEIIG